MCTARIDYRLTASDGERLKEMYDLMQFHFCIYVFFLSGDNKNVFIGASEFLSDSSAKRGNWIRCSLRKIHWNTILYGAFRRIFEYFSFSGAKSFSFIQWFEIICQISGPWNEVNHVISDESQLNRHAFPRKPRKSQCQNIILLIPLHCQKRIIISFPFANQNIISITLSSYLRINIHIRQFWH